MVSVEELKEMVENLRLTETEHFKLVIRDGKLEVVPKRERE